MKYLRPSFFYWGREISETTVSTRAWLISPLPTLRHSRQPSKPNPVSRSLRGLLYLRDCARTAPHPPSIACMVAAAAAAGNSTSGWRIDCYAVAACAARACCGYVLCALVLHVVCTPADVFSKKLVKPREDWSFCCFTPLFLRKLFSFSLSFHRRSEILRLQRKTFFFSYVTACRMSVLSFVCCRQERDFIFLWRLELCDKVGYIISHNR